MSYSGDAAEQVVRAGDFLPGLSPHPAAPGRAMHHLREWHLLLEVVQNTLLDLVQGELRKELRRLNRQGNLIAVDEVKGKISVQRKSPPASGGFSAGYFRGLPPLPLVLSW